MCARVRACVRNMHLQRDEATQDLLSDASVMAMVASTDYPGGMKQLITVLSMSHSSNHFNSIYADVRYIDDVLLFFGWQLIYIVYRQVHSNSANIGTHRKYALHSNDVCACTRRHTVAQLTRLHDTRTSFSSCTRVCRGTRVSFFLISTP